VIPNSERQILSYSPSMVSISPSDRSTVLVSTPHYGILILLFRQSNWSGNWFFRNVKTKRKSQTAAGNA